MGVCIYNFECNQIPDAGLVRCKMHNFVCIASAKHLPGIFILLYEPVPWFRAVTFDQHRNFFANKGFVFLFCYLLLEIKQFI